MHLAHLRLRNFRNYARLDLDFLPGFHLLRGNNAQGKTNILEAIYLLATLRSFRGVGGAQMVRHGETGYFVGGTVIGQGEKEIRMYWSPKERSLSLQNRAVRRVADYLGVLRAVVFCSEDLQLVEATARVRRRFVDLLLTQTHAHYLPLLQRYTQTLRSRNALLKQPRFDPHSFQSFTRELTEAGAELIALRRQLLPRISPLAQNAYGRIGGGEEQLQLEYRPSVQEDFAAELARVQAREQAYRTTLLGPHRDDLLLRINGRNAAEFGSAGQKRSLAIALKIAQAEYLSAIRGTPPVLLIDDIMGELDLRRRSAFLPLLEQARQARGQVFMTCTEENWAVELGSGLHRWEVRQGSVVRHPAD